MKAKRIYTIIGIMFVLILVSADIMFAQCAMCKAVAESEQGEGKMQMSTGLNSGILYLMSIPYIMGAAAGVWFYLRYKKLKSLQSV